MITINAWFQRWVRDPGARRPRMDNISVRGMEFDVASFGHITFKMVDTHPKRPADPLYRVQGWCLPEDPK